MPTALITGVNGQDGSYLAEFLLSEGYRVAGTVRNKASNLDRITHIREYIEIAEVDLNDGVSLEKVIHRFRPDEVYNLAARTSGSEVWTDPVMTGEVNALCVTRLLEAIRNFNTGIRFCQASSSEVFGNALDVPQEETTPLRPRNPYGVAKAYSLTRPQGLNWDWPGSFVLVTSMPGATGATQATTSKRCGLCCSSQRPMTTW